MKAIIQRLTRHIYIAVATFAALATTSAWADATILNYMSFDTLNSNGVAIQKDYGTIDPRKIDGDDVNYAQINNVAAAKLGAHAYQANNGTIGLQDNTSGLVSMSGGWTISFWFHPNGQSNWNSFFGFGLLNGDNYLFLKNGTDAFNVYKDTTTTDDSALGTPALGPVAYTAASWNHVVLACAADTVTLYVNGVSRGRFTVDSTTSLREVLLCRGRWHSGSDSAFYRNKQTTCFDDFALFSGVLSPSAVKTIAMGADTALGLYNAGELNFSRSINVNFYYLYNGSTPYTAVSLNNNGTATVNASSEGYGPYAVTGTYWSDVLATSTAAQSVKVFDGSTTSDSAVTATVSGANGGGFTQSGFDHHLMSGYIGDSSSKLEPTVTFANIPFANYRVVLYFAVSDGSASKKYGYVTLNDTINVAGNGSTTIYGDGGATGWGGAAVAANSQNNILLGQNTLVSPVIVNNASGTLKVKSHAAYNGNTATYYSGLAAIQIVEVTPNSTTGTYTFSPAADTTTAITSSSNWDNLPTGKGEDITISISGDATVNVDKDMAFGTITITSTSESAATLTFTGSSLINASQVNIPANVSVKVASAVSGGAPVLNAPVALNVASSTLEIAAPATMANSISGSGKVVVSANPVVFTAENTFSGGLTIKSGGLAKSENSTGWGSKTVMAVTVQSGGTLDISGEYSTGYNFFIAGTGVDSQGALVNSTAITYGGNLPGNLTLSADATIDCFNAFGVGGSKSLNLNGHILTIKATSAETAKQFYVHGSYMNGGTTADTGKIVLQSNVQLYSNNGNGISSGQQAILLEAQSGSSVSVGASCVNFPVSNTTIADGAALTVDGTLNLQNGKTLTVNGTANISGTANIGQSGNAGSHLVVGGTVNVNGSGTIKLVSTSDITKNGRGIINIAANAQVQWINHNWDPNAGDIFRGEGTLWFDCSGGDYSCTTPHEFGGKLKVTTRTGSNRYAYFSVTDLGQYSGRPALRLECGTEASMGQFRFAKQSKNTTFNVRNFSGWGEIYPNSSDAGTWTINSLQESDTEFSGVFKKYETVAANSAIVVHGNAGEVKSLTLSGASTTEGSATVQDNARLIFSSAGSWANGTVAVADGGYLEVNNPSAVASTLNLQSGGTIKIATYATTETEEEEVETLHARTITAGTVTFPDSGEAAIDISAIPELGEGETATIITASTLLDSDISKLRLVGKPYSLQVSGNNLNVVNDGGLVWDATNGWGTKDATKYDTAIITSPGTVALGGTSLVFDTVGLTGSGTVSFSATGSETVSIKYLIIGDGVTLDVSSALDLTGCTIAGTGTINIPAGVTYTMSNVACSVKVTVQNTGTLKTSGSTNLSSDKNNFVAGSQFTVEGGSSSTRLNGAEKGLSGTITVASGATLVNSRESDSIDYGGATVLNVYGTIDMGATRWSLSDGNTINIYEGAVITGNGQATSGTSNAGAWDWIDNKTCSVNVYGDATISARLRVRSGATVAVAIASGKTLTFSGSYQNYDSSNGSISVSGGVIKLGALNPFVNGSCSCSLTINNGAAIDINGNKPTNQIYLVGDGPDGAGALINTGANMGSDIAMKITLTGDASWGGSYYTHFGASTDIYLDGHTFTKKGPNNFPLNNTVMRGTGKIVVEKGQFQNNNNNNRLDGIDLEVKTGATLNMAGGTSLRIHDFTCAGTISGTGAKLVVNGTCNVNGAQTIPKLEMVTNSAIAFATTSSKLTANTLTFSLPENGKVLLNVAGLDIPSEGMELINCNSTDNFSVSDGYYLDVVNGSVYAYPRVVNVTVLPIANTTVTVTANGESVEGVNGVYTVPYGSAVVVTYAAVAGYELSGTATYNIASATADETIDASGTTVEKYKGVRIIAR